jgi:ParB family chromosome partitioning protein
MELELCTPSHAQALKLKQFSQEGRLNNDVTLSIMQETKPNQVEHFKMPRDKLSRYFEAGTPVATIEETIIKALELYRKRQRSRGQER